jgi:hypothetical protein
LKLYTASLKVADSIPDEVIDFFSVYVIFPAAKELTMGFMFLRSKALPVREANNLTAICEPVV